MRTPVIEPIAIIGSGCHFPGASTSPSKLWELLCEPKDLSKAIPSDRFDPDSFYHPDSTHHGTSHVRNAYVLEEDHRRFDAQFFQTTPTEANSMDPQQRLLLETVYEAIEAAGLKLDQIRGTDTAVYVGVMGGDYNDLVLKDLDSIPTYLSTGTARSILSNRISYFFDWRGPSMTIDTACSSSLVAVHQAVQTLQSGAARMAVVAGANLILGPDNFVAESKLKMLSPTGRCRMWDAAADGYARGDGFAAVVLKRLQDALLDGDDVECIIRGAAVNQDGRTQGITMPSSTNQAALIRQAYASAGLDVRCAADRCQYFEAHGTGTPAGDPIEAAAIAEAFFNNVNDDRRSEEDLDPLFVGSIKTVIGHTEGTAGLAGLLKASLAIRRGFIPPNLHLHRLNPSVKPFCAKLKVPTTLTSWPSMPDGAARRASINSFGFGGTNAHVVLESYPLDPVSPVAANADAELPLVPFNFSAPTREALQRSVEGYVEYLNSPHDISLRDLAYTLACRRSGFPLKLSIGACSLNSLKANLIEALEREERMANQLVGVNPGGILGIFTGQGAHWVGMGRDLILSSRFVSDTIYKLERYLNELPILDRPAWSLREELLADVASSGMDEAALAQPLCTAVQIVLVDLLRLAGVKLAAVVGHSSGEIGAAYAASYLSDRDALYIAYYRGLHSRLAKGPNGERGAMMAVGTTLEDAEQLCDLPELQGRLSVAAVNSGTSITLSGDEDAVAKAKVAFEDEGKMARIINVDKAYHSSHMNACSESYIASLTASKIKVQRRLDTKTAWFSSVYGDLLPTNCGRLEDLYWNTNMIKPVLFSKAISSALKRKGPYAIAIEIGPHPALKRPALQSMEEAGASQMLYKGMLQRSENSLETVSAAFGYISNHLGEGTVNFKALLSYGDCSKPRLLKDLPSYPWKHSHVYWHESQLSKAFRARSRPSHELLGRMLPDSTEQELRWRNILSLKGIPWLQDHRLQGVAVFPAAGYIAMALEASVLINTSSSALKIVEVRDLVIERPITFGEEEGAGIETLFTVTDIKKACHTSAVISANFKCFVFPNTDSATNVLTASGNLQLELGEFSLFALPPRAPIPPSLVEVDVDRFYCSLADLGYQYTGSFRCLSGMKRKFGAATALVVNPSSSTDPNHPLIMHPAMLDSALQALLLAYSWPGDGMLSSLHVPQHITRVSVNVELARASSQQPRKIPLDCVLSLSSTAAAIHGDVGIYYPLQATEESASHTVVQIEGVSVVPVSAATVTDDRKLFEDVIWGPAAPTADSIAEGSSIKTSMALLASQITFRYPHLRLLEIASSGEVATQNILAEIEDAFRSYTLALPSEDTIRLARNQIRHGRVEFKTLDIQSDVLAQGFPAQSYGIIVASQLGHTANALELALRTLRQLLKPGGYLLLPQPLGFQQLPRGDSAAPISVVQCDSILQNAGFSGVDSTKNVDGFSVITTQAVDYRILALREPLMSVWTAAASQEAFIIRGASEPTIRVVEDLLQILQSHFRSVTIIEGIDSPTIDTIPPTATLLSLTDLEEPIFKDLTASKLEGLKRIFDQSRTILWVTRGCLTHDPYASMVVGFGRTVLLETSYLRLQFLDVDPALSVTAEVLAQSLLRLQALQEWSSSSGRGGGQSESDLVWTIEPELALVRDGKFIIPRVLPNRERNDRYNSRRREITKEVNVKTSIVEIECGKAFSSSSPSQSNTLLERLSPPFAQYSHSKSNTEIIVHYSCRVALRMEGLGFAFLVLGHAADTGRRLLALSEMHSSRVSVPQGWYVSWSDDLSEDSEASHLSSVAANLCALALFANVETGDVVLVIEPPPALEAALLRIAKEKHADLHFLTTTTTTDTIPQNQRTAWLHLHPNASSQSIKSHLPNNVSVLVTNTAASPEPALGDIHSRIISYLPVLHRRIDLNALWSPSSLITVPFSTPFDISIQERLRYAASRANLSPTYNSTIVLGLDSLPKMPLFPDIFSVVDWTATSIVAVTLEPVDTRPLFRRDRTYFMAGLAGDLGQSLVQWMVQHGAKYIVLTSRNPRVELRWLDSLKDAGAVIKICSNDITNKPTLQQLVQEIKETLPPIAGVANGAMVLQDTALAETSLEKMHAVMGPKVQGSVYLDELFGDPNDSLDFFIFFSSVAAVVGNRGQSSYSAANAFMSALAAHRRARSLPASVIDIGAVVGTGYLTREIGQGVQDYLLKAGYMWISESDFLQVFAEGVLASAPGSDRGHEVMCGLRFARNQTAAKNAVWYDNPKFQHCVLGWEDENVAPIEGNGVSEQELSVKTKIASATSLAEVRMIVADAFSGKLQKTLLLGADIPLLQQTANDLGVDSLVAITIRSWFFNELDADLPVMKILGGATMGNIIDYAVDQLPPDMLMNCYKSSNTYNSEQDISEEEYLNDSSPTHSEQSSTEQISKPTSRFSSGSKDEDHSAPAPTKVIPMSFSQSRFWFLQSLLEDKTTSNVTCLLSLKGPLKIADLGRAVREVGERHESLRTRFASENGKPLQAVLEKPVLQLETKFITSNAEVIGEFEKMEKHVFDLQSGETMRIVLLVESAVSHHLIISYHHINMDGVSFTVLVTDLAKAYSGSKLTPPALQYPRFSQQQLRSFNSGEWEDQIAYWKREYSRVPAPLPILPFSLVTTRKPSTRYDIQRVKVPMDKALRKAVQDACRKLKVTTFHFYVAVFTVLLVRLSGVEDLSIGIANAGRINDEAFDSIGNFLNVLPLHLQPSTTTRQSFADLLQHTKEKVYTAIANAAVPIDVLFTELGIERSTMHNPLFQAFVDYRNVQETQVFGNCEIEGQEYSIGRTGYDIALDIIDNTAGDTSVSVMVQEDLYTREDAELLLEVFVKLTATFSQDVSQPLQAVSLYEEKRVDKALQLGQGPAFHHQYGTLPHAVDAISQKYPSRVSLKDGLGNVLTYEQMSRKVACMSNALFKCKSNIYEGSTRVAVFQVPSVDWICSMLAIMRVGAIYVPLDLRSGLSRLAAIVKECKPSVILVHSKTIDQVPGLDVHVTTTTVIDVDSLPQSSSYVADVPIWANSSSHAIILYTSGSTGVPKGIALSHYALQNQMEGCISRWGFDEEIVLQQSAYSFDLSVFQIYLSLLTGGTMYCVPREARGDASAIIKIITEERITTTCGVPSELLTWLRFGSKELLHRSQYRMMVSGGEPFSTTLAQELRALGKADLRTVNLYGPAEATISSSTIEVLYHDDTEVLQRPAPAGYTMPNYAVYILDEKLDPVPAGVPGQIAIAGSISSGYVDNSALNEDCFVPNPFASSGWKEKGWTIMHLSGDKGRLRASDGALIFEGRLAGDTQVKLRGIRIELQEVESVIVAAAKGAVASAVASVRGEDMAESIVAHVVVSRTRHSSLAYSYEQQESFLQQLIQDLPLPQYMRPTVLVPLDAMPLTVSGKIDRRAINELSLVSKIHPKLAHCLTRDLNRTESLLKDIWLSLMRNNSSKTPYPDDALIDAETDFFNIGGNSLLLMNLRAKIRDTFGAELSLLQLFEGSSLTSMASKIDNDNQQSEGAAVHQHSIDWENETKVEPLGAIDSYSTSSSAHFQNPLSNDALPYFPTQVGKIVVLTGATGFLGRHILTSLLANKPSTFSIRRIHCIAVRQPDQLEAVVSSDDRVRVYAGNLAAPRLGLSIVDAQRIFYETDTVIHNGADVSFLKSYASLRAANVHSTKELVRLLHVYRYRRSPAPAFHYISSTGVAQLLNQSTTSDFSPASVSSTLPPALPDGSDSYVATKWACERFLERFNNEDIEPYKLNEEEAVLTLRVTIHRPSSITSGAEAEAPPKGSGIVQSLLHYCRLLHAVPKDLPELWHGWIDLVDVDSVADGVVKHVLDSNCMSNATNDLRYVHHSGDHQMPVARLQAWLEEESGDAFDPLPGQEWLERARQAKMDEMVAEFMGSMGKGRKLFTPKILKE